jgi:hypothetical protein
MGNQTYATAAPNEQMHHYFQCNKSSLRSSFGEEYTAKTTMGQAANAFILSIDAFKCVSGVEQVFY